MHRGDSRAGGVAETMTAMGTSTGPGGAAVDIEEQQRFAGELARLAERTGDPGLAALAAGVRAPVQIAVCGRRGVGRRTVRAALAAGGLAVLGDDGPDAPVDVTVYVVAEAVKPEDVQSVTEAAAGHPGRPVLVVLNKTDVPGHADCAAVSAVLGAPVLAMSALLALGWRLDDELWAALRGLADQPGDLRCPESFVTGEHPVAQRVRERLCATLDLPSLQRVLDVVGYGGSKDQACGLLYRLSGLDGVMARLEDVSVDTRAQRIAHAAIRVEAMGVGHASADSIDEFLMRHRVMTAQAMS